MPSDVGSDVFLRCFRYGRLSRGSSKAAMTCLCCWMPDRNAGNPQPKLVSPSPPQPEFTNHHPGRNNKTRNLKLLDPKASQNLQTPTVVPWSLEVQDDALLADIPAVSMALEKRFGGRWKAVAEKLKKGPLSAFRPLQTSGTQQHALHKPRKKHCRIFTSMRPPLPGWKHSQLCMCLFSLLF